MQVAINPAKLSTRPAPLKHKQWVPWAYQTRAAAFLMNGGSALFLDPGLGKTSIVLAAFNELKKMGIAKRMLVIAPKRVCYLVWRQEGQEWTQFIDLNIQLLHGRKKAEALKSEADIMLINPEGIPWLSKQLGPDWSTHFDTVVLDELTKFKNPRSKRFKLLHPRIKKVARRWGLTGTPAPNGLEDLFGQMLILDDGVSLGKYFTHFRDKYFYPSFDGFSYNLQKGAEGRIQKRLAHSTLRMKAEDYIELPEFVQNPVKLKLEGKALTAYNNMKKEMVADLPEGTITAANTAAVYSKLKQMSGGAVYVSSGEDGAKRKVAHIHDLKIDALEELVESLQGQPLLLAYEFNHELERILERFGKDTPYLGKGVSDARAVDIERAWNNNEIPLLPVHPASSGHGLNLQKGNAGHLCWFNPIWDFELYDQLIRRLRRQGNKAERIVEHTLLAEGTIDELALSAKNDKDITQARFMQGLSEALSVKVAKPAEAEAKAVTTETTDMQQLPPSGGAPAGWGAPAGAPATAQAAPPPAQAQATQPAGWGTPPPATGAPASAAAPAPAEQPTGWGAPAPTTAAQAPTPAPATAPANQGQTVDRAAVETTLTQGNGINHMPVQITLTGTPENMKRVIDFAMSL